MEQLRLEIIKQKLRQELKTEKKRKHKSDKSSDKKTIKNLKPKMGQHLPKDDRRDRNTLNVRRDRSTLIVRRDRSTLYVRRDRSTLDVRRDRSTLIVRRDRNIQQGQDMRMYTRSDQETVTAAETNVVPYGEIVEKITNHRKATEDQ